MLFTFLTASGQHEARTPLLNLDFDQVHSSTLGSNAPLDLYYDNLSDILELILLENEDRFDDLSDNKDVRLKSLKTLDDSSPWKRFTEAEIKLQWAFVNFKYGNEWDAFWGLRSAFRAAKKNESEFPNFEPNKRTLGLLNIILGNVPSKNQWFMNLFGLRGDVFKGLSQLNQISNSNPEFATEASLILGMVNAYLLEDFNAAVMLQLTEQESNTPLIQYVKALIYLKAHKAEEARSFLTAGAKKFPIHDYLIAETYFQSGAYKTAITHYNSFINSFQGNSYIKDSYLKLSMSYGFLGQVQLYKDYLEKSRNEGDDYSEIDKNAVKIARDLDRKNPTSLRIRFAIDGGFYSEADSLIEVLDKKQDLSNYERLELVYRKARLNHLQNKTEEAQKHYHEVISNAELISETYYGPNSFLQMGLLMEAAGDIESAKMYFNQVLSFKKHPYKNSLDRKAKIALKQIDLKGG